MLADAFPLAAVVSMCLGVSISYSIVEGQVAAWTCSTVELFFVDCACPRTAGSMIV